MFNSTALSEQLFAETTAEIGEGGSGVFLDVRGFLSDDDTISCATEGEIRTANAGISAAPGHLFLPPDSLMRVIYSNGQSEVFIMINKFGSIPFAPIPGTCG
ncbi:MAG: hypothetical protein IMF09_11995 [Proteobacteria bacterium]|nr:hypothetical protein [Pseudomonadota bacterium]